MKRSYSLDWIRGTFAWEDGFYPDRFTWEEKPVFEERHGMGSYNETVESEFCSISWHNERPEMRIMFQMTGKQLSKARRAGHDESAILRWCLENGLRFTRLDFALDIFDCGGEVLDFSDAWQTTALHTLGRKMTAIKSEGTTENKGNTVYLGSRQSTRMVRVYDKGKERGTALDWIRVEMEWKQDRAGQLAQHMQEHGVKEAGMRHLRDFIPYSQIEWFEDSMGDSMEWFSIESIGRPLTDHERWLHEVCIPAVANGVDNGVPGVLAALRAIIQQYDDRDQHGPHLTIPHE